jgi:hypothetical protein
LPSVLEEMIAPRANSHSKFLLRMIGFTISIKSLNPQSVTPSENINSQPMTLKKLTKLKNSELIESEKTQRQGIDM